MKNIFLLAVMYGVQLKEKDLEDLKSFVISEEQFKASFKIPQSIKTGYRKHKAFKVEQLIELSKTHYGNDLVNNIIDAELEVQNYFLSKAKGYKKKSQITKVENRIREIQGLKIDTSLQFTADEVIKTGMNPKHRNTLLLLSKRLNAGSIKELLPELEKQYVYIPFNEYIDLICSNKDYFAPQLAKAERILEKKLK